MINIYFKKKLKQYYFDNFFLTFLSGQQVNLNFLLDESSFFFFFFFLNPNRPSP